MNDVKLPSGNTISNKSLSDIVEFLVADTLELSGVLADFPESMDDSIETLVGTLAEGGYESIEYDEQDRITILNMVKPVAEQLFIRLSIGYWRLFKELVMPVFPTDPKHSVMEIECMRCRTLIGLKDGADVDGPTAGWCDRCWEKEFPGVPYPENQEKGG